MKATERKSSTLTRVRLLGVFPLDPFDFQSVASITRAVRVASFLAFIPLAILGYWVAQYMFSPEPGANLLISLVNNILFLCSPLILALLVSVSIASSIDYLLSTVNADGYIDEFDFSFSKLKKKAQIDIEETGYFSAKSYWTLKAYEDEIILIEAKSAIKKKYPHVFTD
jgi:hypothetical protein